MTTVESPSEGDMIHSSDVSTIITITGGSQASPSRRRAAQNHFRNVNNITAAVPFMQLNWLHVPLTFSREDMNLQSFPYTEEMVIKVAVVAWKVTKIFVNNGSQVDIIFARAFVTPTFSTCIKSIFS